MKRVLLRAAVVVAVAAVFVAGIIILLRGWSDPRLEGYKRTLRAKGEKLLVSELLSSPPGLTNLLIPRLVAANRQFGPGPPTFELMQIGADGRAMPAWKKTNEWLAMHKQVDLAEGALIAMRDALRTPERDLGWDQTNWSTFPSSALIELRATSHRLSAAIVIELNRGRQEEALSYLIALLNLADCFEEEGTLVFQMIRVALSGVGFAATWEALQASGWSDEQLARLQAAWREVKLLPTLEFALEMERARGLDYFEIAHGRPSNDPGLTQPFDSVGEAMYAPIWKVALASGDELTFLQTMQHFLDALRAARQKSSGAELQKRLVAMPKRGWFAEYRYPMAQALIPNLQKALIRAIKGEVERQLALTAIGLERYRLRYGRYPEKLYELVPEILAGVPVDFGDGKPLRYKRVGDNYELWSQWENTRWPQPQ
ncbi:MAG TPA: hypothetical protein VJ063_18385 [Verrucomicrobiae bacterium]|nr:hypothetical protein [Verrucomicrobiae bacterium]